ncbi:MAG: hypothetical protein JRF40_04500 [Deltaproteobacteria bacterium]|nr:hypothetical protein [Deltaproteobacteria bacterium]MBW2218742.1 hypothetical protein [Deltaproteobacteria bacterium]
MPNPEDQLSYIQWKDLKNVRDHAVYSFGLIVQKMRAEVTNVINVVGDQAGSTPLSQSNFVSLMILFRIRECMISIELLVSKGLIRDAAALLLKMIEYRLGIQYIATDSLHAKEWIRKKRENENPWKTSFLINTLFPDRSKNKAEYEMFEYVMNMQCSDPMENQPDFPIKDDELSSVSNDDLAVCLFYEGSECYKILNAVIKDFSDSGFEIQTNMQALEELNELKDKLKSLKKVTSYRLPKRYFPNA